jgi:hypothetical protein
MKWTWWAALISLILSMVAIAIASRGEGPPTEQNIDVLLQWGVYRQINVRPPADHFGVVFMIDSLRVPVEMSEIDTFYYHRITHHMVPGIQEGYHYVWCGVIPYNSHHETWQDSAGNPIIHWTDHPARLYLHHYGRITSWWWYLEAKEE